jgi:hypothetical protein
MLWLIAIVDTNHKVGGAGLNVVKKVGGAGLNVAKKV